MKVSYKNIIPSHSHPPVVDHYYGITLYDFYTDEDAHSLYDPLVKRALERGELKRRIAVCEEMLEEMRGQLEQLQSPRS